MTRKTYGDLGDDPVRIHPDVEAAMRDRWDHDQEYEATPWVVEDEVPAETNGWIYAGNPGALSTTHSWVDAVDTDESDERVVLHITPTHPRDETSDVLRVRHDTNLDDETDPGEIITEIEGEPYRTPLHVRRRMFWEGVEAAVEWMEENAPGSD